MSTRITISTRIRLTKSGGDTKWSLVTFGVFRSPHLRPNLCYLPSRLFASEIALKYKVREHFTTQLSLQLPSYIWAIFVLCLSQMEEGESNHLFHCERRIVPKISDVHRSSDVVPAPAKKLRKIRRELFQLNVPTISVNVRIAHLRIAHWGAILSPSVIRIVKM